MGQKGKGKAKGRVNSSEPESGASAAIVAMVSAAMRPAALHGEQPTTFTYSLDT